MPKTQFTQLSRKAFGYKRNKFNNKFNNSDELDLSSGIFATEK